jgi:hypothetical protein
MPPLIAILPTIAAIAGLAGTGVGLGLELSNSGGGSTPAPTPPTPAMINQNQQAIRASIGQQAPNVISSTSGLANPDYVAQIAQLLAGTGGQTGSTGAARQVAAQLFGLNSDSVNPSGAPAQSFTPAGTGQNPGPETNSPVQLTDFINRFMLGGT